MKTKRALLCISWFAGLAIGASQPLQAQLDTTGFPLDIGNKWFYRYQYKYGSFSTLHVRVKEIIDTTQTGTRIVRITRLNQDSTLGTEQWRVLKGSFYVNSLLLYNASLTHDTSWTFSGPAGTDSYSYQLRTVNLFRSTSRCQIHTESHWSFFASSEADHRVALGVGLYYDYYGGFGGESPRWDQYYTLIGFLKNGQFFGDSVLTSVQDGKNLVPAAFELRQNYPNPFNPTTKIEFQISKASQVTLKVYNALGQNVATLVNDRLPAGQHRADFNANTLTSGVYLYRLESGTSSLTRKMLVLQ
jgi:hypothetical protein